MGFSPEAPTGLDLNHTLYLVLTLLSEKSNQHLRFFYYAGALTPAWGSDVRPGFDGTETAVLIPSS